MAKPAFPLTKQQITDYLDANGVHVEETVLGGTPKIMEYLVYGRRFGHDTLLETFDTEAEAENYIDSFDNPSFTNLNVVENANPEKYEAARL